MQGQIQLLLLLLLLVWNNDALLNPLILPLPTRALAIWTSWRLRHYLTLALLLHRMLGLMNQGL